MLIACLLPSNNIEGRLRKGHTKPTHLANLVMRPINLDGLSIKHQAPQRAKLADQMFKYPLTKPSLTHSRGVIKRWLMFPLTSLFSRWSPAFVLEKHWHIIRAVAEPGSLEPSILTHTDFHIQFQENRTPCFQLGLRTCVEPVRYFC